MGRKSLAEVEVRRNDVFEMLLEGKSSRHIIAYINVHYGVGRSTVEADMTAVRKELVQQFHMEKQDVIALHVKRYEHMYQLYMDRGSEAEGWNPNYNPEIASKMLEKKEKLLQLHNPDVLVQNNTLNINFKEYSKEDIKEILGLQ